MFPQWQDFKIPGINKPMEPMGIHTTTTHQFPYNWLINWLILICLII